MERGEPLQGTGHTVSFQAASANCYVLNVYDIDS
jgi:hypothetical protein